jgi:hypothetical protein
MLFVKKKKKNTTMLIQISNQDKENHANANKVRQRLYCLELDKMTTTKQ